MLDNKKPFSSDWMEAPGELIHEILEERHWSEREFAQRLALNETWVTQLLLGTTPITPDIAQHLADVLGSTTDFWLTLEANYQQARQH